MVPENRFLIKTVDGMTEEMFFDLCPDFVMKVRSATDHLSTLKAGVEEYRTNGCRLGWRSDRPGKAVHPYHADGSTETVKGESVKLPGGDVSPGLVLKTGF